MQLKVNKINILSINDPIRSCLIFVRATDFVYVKSTLNYYRSRELKRDQYNRTKYSIRYVSDMNMQNCVLF